MTEAELLEHYWSAQEMGISSFLAYISIADPEKFGIRSVSFTPLFSARKIC